MRRFLVEPLGSGNPSHPALPAAQTGAPVWLALVACLAILLSAGLRPLAGQDAAAADDTLDEQTIYIPYEKLREVFEKEGRGVFLPYEKFQELWQAAHGNTRPIEAPSRPVGALIQEIDSRASIADAVVEVTATLKIEVPPTGWNEVPLRLADAALRSASLNGEAARIVFDPQAGYKLLLENAGEEPQQVELTLDYLKAYDKSPGQSSFFVQAPQAPINRWTIRVPEAGVDVEVEPMIAASKNDANEDETELQAFVGAAERVVVRWNPKSEGAAGLEAFATVRTEQQFVVGDGVLRSAVRFDYDISRAPLAQMAIEIPANQKVINVFDRNVKRWDISEDGEVQTLQVELFEPAREKQSLLLELERFVDIGDGALIEVPLLKAVDVGRQQGIVVARLEDGLQAEATQRIGLLQLDPSELAESLRGTAWGFAFRYGALPYELSLAVRKVSPRINVAAQSDVRLTPEELAVTWRGIFRVEQAGVFQFALDIPEGYEVRNITGLAIPGGQPAQVESFHRDRNSETRWQVNLSRRAFGPTGLVAELRRSIDHEPLRTPTGESVEIAVDLPRVVREGLEHSEGTVVVSAPEQLRVNPSAVTGLRPISFEEASQSIALPPRTGQLRPVLAFHYASGDTELSLDAERRRPFVSVSQLLRNDIDAGVVTHSSRFFYDIKYSGVPGLRIDVPEAIADAIRNASGGIRHQAIDPPPEDVAEGYVAWDFSAESELLGSAEIILEWEQKLDELTLGSSLDLEIPRLIPRNANRSTGQILLGKTESIDLYPVGTPEGLQQIDPQRDLMPQADGTNVALALEYVDDWSLTMRATRYELEESKPTSIDRGLVRIVALSNDELSVQALYRVKSARQRLAIELPADAEFDAQPVRINGQTVVPESDATGTLYVPLANLEEDQSFLLEMRYSVAGQPDRLDMPRFPDDPAVQKVFLCVYLPPSDSVVASRGAWTDEQVEVRLENRPEPDTASDFELINWVRAGVENVVGDSAVSFPVGHNQLFVYSTLRPDDPPSGSLQLITINRNLLNGIVFLVVACIGLPLYGRTLGLQLVAVGSLVVTLLVLGVFMPNLSQSVMGGVLWLAVGAVAVVWVVGHARKFLKHQRLVRPPAMARVATRPAAAANVTAAQAPTGEAEEAAHKPDFTPVADQSPPPAQGQSDPGNNEREES